MTKPNNNNLVTPQTGGGRDRYRPLQSDSESSGAGQEGVGFGPGDVSGPTGGNNTDNNNPDNATDENTDTGAAGVTLYDVLTGDFRNNRLAQLIIRDQQSDDSSESTMTGGTDTKSTLTIASLGQKMGRANASKKLSESFYP